MESNKGENMKDLFEGMTFKDVVIGTLIGIVLSALFLYYIFFIY